MAAHSAGPQDDTPQKFRAFNTKGLVQLALRINFSGAKSESEQILAEIGDHLCKKIHECGENFCLPVGRASDFPDDSADECIQFTEWVIRFLLNLFAQPPQRDRTAGQHKMKFWIFEKCSKALILLLRTVARNDITRFKILQSNLLTLAVDLIRFRLTRVRSKQMSESGARIQLLHFDKFGPTRAELRTRGWRKMVLSTGTDDYEVEHLILGVVTALVESRSFNRVDLDDDTHELFFRMGHVSQISMLQNRCFSWFTCASKWQDWNSEKVSSFLNKWFEPIITNEKFLRAKDQVSIASEVKGAIRTIFHLLVLAERQTILRQELLLILIRIGWNSDEVIHSEIAGHIVSIASVYKLNKDTDRLFAADAEFLTRSMLRLLMDKIPPLKEPQNTFVRGVQLFGENAFNQAFKHLMIPVLTENRNDLIDLFKKITSKLRDKVQEQVVFAVSDICAALVLRLRDWTQISQSIELCSSLTGIDMTHTMTKRMRLVARDILFHYHTKKENVRQMMYHMMSSKSEKTVRKGLSDRVLKHFLTSSRVLTLMVPVLNLRIKKKAITANTDSIRSLIDLMRIAGDEGVRQVQSLIAPLLNYCVRIMHLSTSEYETIADLYTVYVDTVPVIIMQTNLLLICSDLNDYLLVNCRPAAISLLEKVICDRAAVLEGRLREVTFVINRLDHDFERINKAIDEACAKFPEEPLFEYIMNQTREIGQVREAQLKVLKIANLSKYMARHYESLIHADQMHPCISKLISTLLKDAKEPDEELALAIARCLGEIGAIDPIRFDVIPASDSYPENQILDHTIRSDQFMKQLVTKIARSSVCHSEARFQWIIMYVLQELMRSMDINRQTSFLKLLDADVRGDCDSATDSQFTIRSEGVWNEVLMIPDNDSVFEFKESKSDPPLKYEQWLRIWAKRMIRMLDQSSMESKVLMGCTPLFTNDYRFTESLLPSIIFNFLRDESIVIEDRKRVTFYEMEAVIDSAVPNHFETEGPRTFDTSTYDHRVVVSAPVLSDLQQLSAQQVFVVYDTLLKWNAKENVPLVQELIEYLSKDKLATLAYACRSYARSIMYLEMSLRENDRQKNPTHGTLELLQKNFIAMDEPDGVVGVDACRSETPSLIDRIVANESTLQLRRALTCCEFGSRSHPDDIAFRKLTMRCLLSLDLTQEAFHYGYGLMQHKPEWKPALLPFQIQTAWRLSKWDRLSELLADVDFDAERASTDVHFGRILSLMANSDVDGLYKALISARQKALSPIAAIVSEKGAYVRCYRSLVKLHIITDMQRAAIDFCNLEPESNPRPDQGLAVLQSIWGRRNECVMTSSHALEPILKMQRVLCTLCPDQDQLCKQLTESWLTSAMIARKSCNLPKAENCVLAIQSLMNNEVVTKCKKLVSRILVEVAKCYWADPSTRDQAIRYLSHGLDKHFAKHQTSTPNERSVSGLNSDSVHFARVRLLHTKFLEESQSVDSKKLIEGYTIAMQADPKWEKPVFCLARLYDRLVSVTSDTTARVKLMDKACRLYYTSLERGCKKIYQSLPRLIDLWCDIGTLDSYHHAALGVSAPTSCLTDSNKRKTGPAGDKSRRKTGPAVPEKNSELQDAANVIRPIFDGLTSTVFANIHKNLPSQYLYTAFSQLLSRVTHTNPKLTGGLFKILARIVTCHRQQCMWLMLSAIMSDKKVVSDAAAEIIRQVKSERDRELHGFIDLMVNTGNQFLSLANEPTTKKQNMQLSSFRSGNELKRLLKNSDILVPHRKFMRVQMPSSGVPDNDHQYFSDPVTIQDIEEAVTIFHSIAKPRKVLLVGSDGNRYPLLVKPKDDMRMDSRMIELIEMMNRLLKKDSESRKRQLSIRSFNVVPLGREGGLVEFIDGLRDIRSILFDKYVASSKTEFKCILQKVKDKYPGNELSLTEARHKFTNDIMQTFKPAVFGDWFLDEFRDATVWHLARNEFTRSLAVMSIVGYVIGLGDRHLENILLDTTTGQAIHVDFNVIFNKGLTLTVPEVVPFRLTHNLIDAMGPTGYEGHFRKTCEITLNIMRNNREELMSLLKPFVFEPYADTSSSRSKVTTGIMAKVNSIVSGKGSATVGDIEKIEVQDETAAANLAMIDDRLRGRIHSQTDPNPLPLSVAGQVDYLIQEAVKVDNLCRMYVGWASYL